MAIRALDFMAKVSSRFIHEILPVAMASVIGAMLVNHYGRQPASPAIVIQAPPSASEDAMEQSLREAADLIAVFMKRKHERERDEEGSGSVATQVASVAPIPLSLVDPPLPEPRPAGQKTVGRALHKPRAWKQARSGRAPGPTPGPSRVGVRAPATAGLLAAPSANSVRAKSA